MSLKPVELISVPDTNEVEYESGKIIERRSFLWLSLAAVTSLSIPKRVFAQDTLIENSITWDDFLKECLPKATELYKDKSGKGQESYLHWIASLAAKLNYQTLPKAKLGKFAELEPPIEFGLSYRGVPFFVVEWKMAAHSELPPHCHPNASVCTVGLEGEARIRNFETVGTVPEFNSNDKFNVCETQNELISAGRINILTSQRDNIHTFKAGKKGAWGIDISTYHGKDIGFSFLKIDSKPIDEEKRLFAANWRKVEDLKYE